MINKLSALCALFFTLAATAATITGDPTTLLGYNAGNSGITIKGYDLPQVYRGVTYLNVQQRAQLTNGLLNVTIIPPGRYDLTFDYGSTTLRIIVPPSDDTYDISTMFTNVVVWVQRGIDTQISAGANITIATNNAGMPNETLVISSTGSGGGNATNAYQVQVSGAGLSLSTNALQYIYTLSLNANLQSWGAIAPSAKQDALGYVPATNSIIGISNIFGFMPQPTNNNLTLWGALAPSAKQDHSANLDFWSGVSGVDGTTILNTGGILSAATGGSGNVTGAASSTNQEVVLMSGTGGKTIIGSGHFLGDYTTFGDGTNIVQNMTLPIDAGAVSGLVTGMGVTSSTNLAFFFFRNNLSITPTGTNGFYWVDAASGGGGAGASALIGTNIYIRDTNALILDFSKAQTFNVGNLTNGTLVISNANAITNLACHDVQINLHQWTNGAAPLLALKNVGGNLTTNNPWTETTNGNGTDILLARLDGTDTNIVLTAETNVSSYIDTNSLLTASGGGGGTSSPFITAFPSDGTTTVPSGQDGYGYKFTVGSSAMIVTDLGFRVNSGNTGVHTVSIYDNSAVLVVSATVDLTGQSAGTVVYTSITPTTLTASSTYIEIITMTTGETFQNDTSTVTTTADATIVDSDYHDGSGFHVYTPGAHAFGIPNLKYHL